jgi:hypothetical protein
MGQQPVTQVVVRSSFVITATIATAIAAKKIVESTSPKGGARKGELFGVNVWRC